MTLSTLAVFFAFLAVVAAAIWLISRRPLFEPVAAFLGALATLLAVVSAVSDTQVSRTWAIIIATVGLGLFAWGMVRAFRITKPFGGALEYRPTPEQRQRNRRAMLELEPVDTESIDENAA